MFTELNISPVKRACVEQTDHPWIKLDPAAKSGGPESKSPTLNFSKWGFAWAEFNPV
jgi:hypothetical protein